VNASRNNAMRKPDAGNLHVRFDEGEGTHRSLAFEASHPVRPSLLYWLNPLAAPPAPDVVNRAFKLRLRPKNTSYPTKNKAFDLRPVVSVEAWDVRAAYFHLPRNFETRRSPCLCNKVNSPLHAANTLVTAGSGLYYTLTGS
jgi:hypothetical protein